MNTIFTAPAHGCTTAMVCHDASGTAAGFDMASVGWQNALVGKAPVAGAGLPNYPTVCANMGFVFLKAGSNPATGLFLDKMNPATLGSPPCGMHMPELYTVLSATEFSCVQSWATTLTSP